MKPDFHREGTVVTDFLNPHKFVIRASDDHIGEQFLRSGVGGEAYLGRGSDRL